MNGGKTTSEPSPEKDPGAEWRAEPQPATLAGPVREDSSIVAEPIPEWGPALQTWEWAWELHWIGFGAIFMLLALHALISLIEIAGKKSRVKRGKLGLAVTSLLFTFGLTRSLFFFINPYESEQCNLLPKCSVILTRILFGIALPCITASFSLVHLAFLQVTKLQLYPEKLQSGTFLFCIIAFHFSLALVTEVMTSLYADWKALGIVCKAFYIVFNLILSVSFIYSGTKIVRHVQRNHSRISSLGDVSIRVTNSKEFKSRRFSARQNRPNISKLVKITYITVFLGFASCALQLYSIFGVHNMYASEDARTPEPWAWFIFQSLYRAVEVVAGGTLAYVCPRQVFQRDLKLSRFTCCRNTDEKGCASSGIESGTIRNSAL